MNVATCHPDRKGVALGLCSSCWQKQNLIRKPELHERRRLQIIEWRRALKFEVLTHYGNGKAACIRCGFDDARALQIDHVFGGGAKEIRAHGQGGTGQYLRLKKAGFPPGYQTLCANCNWIKADENQERANLKKKEIN